MPNYNYRSNDYMRRGQCRGTMIQSSAPIERDCNFAVEDSTKEGCMIDPLREMPIAMAYVPWQEFKNLYTAEKAFCRGTLFEELDKPFSGKGGCCK